jgi:hypothetical protein
MLASFIIPFHTARLDNLLQTLRFLEKNHLNVIQESELLLMCQNRCGNIETLFKNHKLFNLEMSYMNISKAINIGFQNSHSDNIIILESDRILPRDYFQNVLDQLTEKHVITTKTMYRIRHMVTDENIEKQQFLYDEEFRNLQNLEGTRNLASGNMVMKKSDFIPYDETYTGYGFMDHDTTNNLIKNGIEPIWRDEIELHLYHERFTYGEGDQKEMFYKNAIYYAKKWKLPIAEIVKKEKLLI